MKENEPVNVQETSNKPINKVIHQNNLINPQPYEEMKNSAISRTSEIIDKFGPRLTTTESCRKAADAIYNELNQYCDKAYSEDIQIQPYGALVFHKYMISLYFVALFFMWINMPSISLICLITSILIFVFEFLLSYKVVERFHKAGTARNVHGYINPEGEVENIIIFSGHHDSAHIFNFYVDHPEMYQVREKRFLIVYAMFFITVVYHAISSIKNFGLFGHCSPTKRSLIISLIFTIGSRFIVPIWGFLNEEGTCGAGDNLISSSVAVELAKYYSEHRDLLKHTKLVFISYDAEETLLRGSREFWRMHKHEYEGKHVWNVNSDCPYFVDEISFLVSDINGFLPLSEKLANKLVEISHELGLKEVKTKKLLCLAGGTDAAEAQKVGIQATTLLGVPYTNKDRHGRDVVYHTARDTIEAVEPEAVSAMLAIFTKFVEKTEAGELE
ncbi:M28 family peptidase [Histomonas meleagridis]|uniref:M28 family peptidase n=1 Tax=Histomonas meleagridis TaxID=135588 RepID=UPI0035598F57|nr:M28 family peptidase [Histomonas meleagridis]KAH0806150.1 M28 family peptidase [Histomonas meleagridis]